MDLGKQLQDQRLVSFVLTFPLPLVDRIDGSLQLFLFRCCPRFGAESTLSAAPPGSLGPCLGFFC